MISEWYWFLRIAQAMSNSVGDGKINKNGGIPGTLLVQIGV